MKSQHLVILGMVITSITGLVLAGAWGRDAELAGRRLVTDVAPSFGSPISMTKCYRVNCADNTATTVLVAMDGGSSAYPEPASSIFIAPCDLDVDGGNSTCITERDIRVGSSDINEDKGIKLGGGAPLTAISLDAKGAYCAGVGGAQQADVCIGRQ